MTNNTTSGLQGGQQVFIAGVFDVERLMAAAAAQPAQREALLALMDKVCQAALREMDGALAAWRAGQPDQAAVLIHSLRGSIGTLGASLFAATSRELESAVKQGRATPALFERAQQELQASVQAAQAWLAAQPRLPRADSVADSGAVARWKTLLAERNIDAVTQYPQIRPALAALGPARATAIDHAMARLDFAGALHALGEQP